MIELMYHVSFPIPPQFVALATRNIELWIFPTEKMKVEYVILR